MNVMDGIEAAWLWWVNRPAWVYRSAMALGGALVVLGLFWPGDK